jgi:hypothetical protein
VRPFVPVLPSKKQESMNHCIERTAGIWRESENNPSTSHSRVHSQREMYNILLAKYRRYSFYLIKIHTGCIRAYILWIGTGSYHKSCSRRKQECIRVSSLISFHITSLVWYYHATVCVCARVPNNFLTNGFSWHLVRISCHWRSFELCVILIPCQQRHQRGNYVNFWGSAI